MNEGKSKISKQEGVNICAKLLYYGKGRQEILQEITTNYKASVRTIDSWIKEAQPKALALKQEDDAIRREQDVAAIIESATRLNISRDWVLEGYHKMATYDPRNCFNEDGSMKPLAEWGDAEIYALGGMGDGKIKWTSRKEAFDAICRVMGYNAPDKTNPFKDLDLTKATITFS